MYKVIEDSCDRFGLEFDNHNERSFSLNPKGATDEFIELLTGGESASIAISLSFRKIDSNETKDSLYVFENIAGDELLPGPHEEGTVLKYDQTSFDGEGLLSSFDNTKLEVIVGSTREDPFVAKLILSKEGS